MTPTSLPMCPKWQNEIKRSENRWMDWYKFYIIYTVYRKESNLAFWSQNISVVKLPWLLYTQHCRRMSKNMENIHTYSLTGNTLVFSMNQNSSGCSRVNQWASGSVVQSNESRPGFSHWLTGVFSHFIGSFVVRSLAVRHPSLSLLLTCWT